jgi:hypothetical protein
MVLERCSKSPLNIEAMVEGKDVAILLFVPVGRLCFDSRAEVECSSISEDEIRRELARNAEYSKLQSGDKQRKQIDAFVAKSVEQRKRWIRDALLGSGAIDPTYSILGVHGLTSIGKQTLAEHLKPKHYLHVFDTNILMRHLISNYFRLRVEPSVLKDVLAAIPPAVLWELEDVSNREESSEEERAARSAFRDVAYVQSSMKRQAIPARLSEDKPSDRLIRLQIRQFNWQPLGVLKPEEVKTEAKIFMTFDRVSALAAQAEGLACCSLDVPLEQQRWTVAPIGSQSFEEMVGTFLAELSVLRGTVKVSCAAGGQFFLLGDWPGKTGHEWVKGHVRYEDAPLTA